MAAAYGAWGRRWAGLADGADLLLKCIVIGDSGTGKSCLLHRLEHGKFKERATQTIGVEFSSHTVAVGDKSVKLQLWDSAGQERFRSVTRSYYRAAAMAILVYDIACRASFDALERWLSDARALASPQLVVVLVGNKLDRGADERDVSHAEAARWADEQGALFAETSCVSGAHVEEPFVRGTQAVLLAIESGRLDPERVDSGVSYGDRALHDVSGRFSVNDASGWEPPPARSSGLVRLRTALGGRAGGRAGGCCG